MADDLTPGQAAYEAFMASCGLDPYLPGDTWDAHYPGERRNWDAAAAAVAADRGRLAVVRGLMAERDRYRQALERICRGKRSGPAIRAYVASVLAEYPAREALDSECSCPCHGQTLSGVHGTCCLPAGEALAAEVLARARPLAMADDLTPGQAARQAWKDAWDAVPQAGRGTPGWDSLACEERCWERAAMAAVDAVLSGGAGPQLAGVTATLAAATVRADRDRYRQALERIENLAARPVVAAIAREALERPVPADSDGGM